jgi:peptidyl-prolyl cis-trans isomerase B (cyclophilin B)
VLHGTLGGQNPTQTASDNKEECGVPTNKQRRATAKRKLERQLERRAKQAHRRRVVTIAALAAVVVVVAGGLTWWIFFHKASSGTPTASSTASSVPSSVPPTPETAAPNQAGVLPKFNPPAGLGSNCQYEPTPKEPAAKKVDPPKAGPVPTQEAKISMSIETNQGPFGIQLNNAQAPCTVNNFVSLATKNYFDGTHCHRLTTGPSLFVLQCGDPKGDGTGGPGYQFADEYPSNQYPPDDPARNNPVVYPRGTLAMANAGPGTNGSQFFIVYKNSELPPNYTVFGQVDDKDMPLFDKIAQAGTQDGTPDGKPKTDVEIKSAKLD